MSVTSRIVAEQQLRQFLKLAPQDVRKALKNRLDRAGIRLAARMKEKLSGDVLQVRTGRLRRSITSKGTETSQGYVVTVGTNVRYAAAHEYGFTGAVQVPQHLRLVRKAWGRPVRKPTKHLVRAHAMRMHLPERSFARSSLAELEGSINADLQQYIENVIRRMGP